MGTTYILPGSAEAENNAGDPSQATPLLRYYSPRLFGAPPQLTNQCDMRILSSKGNNPGAVGDFYLTRVLQDANVVNFNVGKARFTGGTTSKANIFREMIYYANALKKYNIYGSDGNALSTGGAAVLTDATEDAYKKAYGERDTEETPIIKSTGGGDVDADTSVADMTQYESMFSQIDAALGAGSILAALKTSLSVQQPFYTFEPDWNTYINNVKMMINTAVIMLGLQGACVRIGDFYYPIGMKAEFDDGSDTWANYRYMTPTSGLGSATAAEKDNGDSTQYVSFMIDPTGISENITNSTGPSQLFSSVINSGSSVGAEIAFITNATAGSSTDTVVKLGKDSRAAAEEIMKNMSSGNGRFTAAIASSMARSFTGDHTIYPEVFQSHSATTSLSVTTHLSSDGGDPYSYLINILVPTFFILGMALPQLSPNNASAYTFPPLIQCNIPGMWGTRLGIIESVQINKNPNGKDVSINGYPLQVDITINVKDLQHVLMTSPMNKVSTFLNNHTMFDYIAQLSGVDKYRVNGAMRTVARLALASSYSKNFLNNVGDALLSDWHSLSNRVFGWGNQ